MSDKRLPEAQARHPDWIIRAFGGGWLAVRKDEEALHQRTGKGSVWRAKDLGVFLDGLDKFIADVDEIKR